MAAQPSQSSEKVVEFPVRGPSPTNPPLTRTELEIVDAVSSIELRSEDAVAMAAVAFFDGRLLYLDDERCFAYFDPLTGVWTKGDGMAAMNRLSAAVREVAVKKGDSDQIIKTTGSTAFKRGVLTSYRAERGMTVSSSTFDGDLNLIGTPDGVLDLRTQRIREPRYADRITMKTKARYAGKPLARYHDKRWLYFLHHLTGGDEHFLNWLQVYFGSMLAGNIHERFTLVYGTGGTGKSTFLAAVGNALGDYAMEMGPHTLVKGPAQGAREDLASMENKRFVYTGELPTDRPLDINLIKTLTGRDRIRARHLYRNAKVLEPTWSMAVACNELPRGEADEGFLRRCMLIPLHRRISTAKRDPELKRALLGSSHCADAVLYWLIVGLSRYRQSGMIEPPPEVVAANREYTVKTAPVQVWRGENWEDVPGAFTPTQTLWEHFQEWCRKQKLSWETIFPDRRAFGREMAKRWLTSKKNGRRGFRGVQRRTKEPASFEEFLRDRRRNRIDLYHMDPGYDPKEGY